MTTNLKRLILIFEGYCSLKNWINATINRKKCKIRFHSMLYYLIYGILWINYFNYLRIKLNLINKQYYIVFDCLASRPSIPTEIINNNDNGRSSYYYCLMFIYF